MNDGIHFQGDFARLLERAGFAVKNRRGAKGPDIIAEAEKERLIFQCKQAEKYGKKFNGIVALRDQYRTLRSDHDARAAILVLSGYKLPKNVMTSDSQKKWLEKYRVAVWGDEQIEYYKRLVSALGKWSRYQIFGDLEIKRKGGQQITAQAVPVDQPGGRYYLFKIEPSKLLPIAYVFRRQYSKLAYQRMLNRKRLKNEIGEYLQGRDAFLPTNLVCVFEQGITYNPRKRILEIPNQYGSAWIIDGQHRLYGFCSVPDELMDSFEIVCTGFNGKKAPMSSLSKQGSIFVDINQTAKRIPQALLLDLYDLIGRRDVRVEVVKQLSKHEIFADNIKFYNEKKGAIDFASFVQTPPMKNLLDYENGMTRQYYKKKISYEKYRDKCSKGLLGFFKEVRRRFRKEWNSPRRYMLATNKGIRALLRLLEDIVKREGKPFERIDFSPYLRALKGIELRQSQLKGLYAGEGGADELADQWARHIKENGIPDFHVEGRGMLEQESFYSGQREEAEKFVQKWLRQLGGEVYGELAYVDPSTFKYLKYLTGNCSRVRIRIGLIKDEQECVNAAKTLDERGLRVEMKQVEQKGPSDATASPAIHERWLAGNNYEIDFGTDLKYSSLGGKKHSVQISENSPFARSERYEDVKRSWRQFGASGKATTIRTVYPPEQ